MKRNLRIACRGVIPSSPKPTLVLAGSLRDSSCVIFETIPFANVKWAHTAARDHFEDR